MLGTTIRGRYRVTERIGNNSISVVYLAQDLSGDRLVTIKTIHPELTESNDFSRSFRRSARLMGKVISPYIVRLLDFGEIEGSQFIVQECVLGLTLENVLIDHAPLHPARALHFARQIAQGMSDACAVGLVHGDIRPPNLVVTAGEVVKILDFGVAAALDLPHLMAAGRVNLPYYLAPELPDRGLSDVRTDVYSLGVLLFYMVTGQVPYSGGGGSPTPCS
jgi:serine/threonine protein kinase